ncbi:MAG: hypothetical protein ABL907_14365 [Hyphomicrobium sp.]
MAATALERFSAQIGELAQRQLSNDSDVAKTSEWYYGFQAAVLNRNPEIGTRMPPCYLEIACYRHVLGYKLAKDRGFDSTQFDICDRDLSLGKDIALTLGLPDTVDRAVYEDSGLFSGKSFSQTCRPQASSSFISRLFRSRTGSPASIRAIST